MSLGYELFGQLDSFRLQVLTDGEACVLLEEVTQVVFVHEVSVAKVVKVQLRGEMLIQVSKDLANAWIDCYRGRPYDVLLFVEFFQKD